MSTVDITISPVDMLSIRYIVLTITDFSFTECFLCKYFKGRFHWTQEIFFVGQIGRPDNRKNAARAYRSKTLGEGLEQMRQQKTLMRVNQKEFDPTGITYPPRFRIPQ